VGSAALGILVLVRHASLPGRRELAGIVVCGALWFGVYNVALNAAEERVDAGTQAMLVNIGPILIAIVAGVLLRVGFPSRLLAGCLVSFAGAVAIGVATSRHGLHESLGAVLCLVAAAAYAAGVVAQKPVLRHASRLSVTWLACTTGAISCLPYAASLVYGIRHAGDSTIAWMVYLGVGPTAAGFLLWHDDAVRLESGMCQLLLLGLGHRESGWSPSGAHGVTVAVVVRERDQPPRRVGLGVGRFRSLVLLGGEWTRQHEVGGGAVARRRNVADHGDPEKGLHIDVVRLRLQGIPEEDQEVDPPLGDRGADLLIAAERTAEEPVHFKTKLTREQRTGRPGRVQLVGRQRVAIEPGPFEHFRFAIVVRDQRDALPARHQFHDLTHGSWPRR
jgi:drug/metabolite transporter (DMT)-like permease